MARNIMPEAKEGVGFCHILISYCLLSFEFRPIAQWATHQDHANTSC